MRTLKLAVLSAILAIGLAACTATTSPTTSASAPTVVATAPPPGVTPLPNPNTTRYQFPADQAPFFAEDMTLVVRGTIRAVESVNGPNGPRTRILVNTSGGCYYSFSAPAGAGGSLSRGNSVIVVFHPYSNGTFAPANAAEGGRICGNAQPQTTGYAIAIEVTN